MGFDATLYIDFVLGALVGWLLGGGFVFMAQAGRITALERDNAALAQSRDAMDDRFRAAAQEALQKSNEQFLQLAQEKLKNAQNDGAHDLDKRRRAIDEMIKPVREHLKALSGALEQVKGTDQALREDVRNLNRETARLAGALARSRGARVVGGIYSGAAA